MDITTLLIIAQIAFVFLAGALFLFFYARRQKKTVAHLQQLLLDVQANMGGDLFKDYLHQSMNETQSHCEQGDITFNPDAEPGQMAIALRHHALATELSHVNAFSGGMLSWDDAIAPYTEISQALKSHTKAASSETETKLGQEIERLRNLATEERQSHEQTLNKLDLFKAIETVFQQASQEGVTKQVLEMGLHKALLALAEKHENIEALRETIYLMHEGYIAALNSKDSDIDAALGETEEVYDTEEMFKLIEQFTEESAELVERIYMLNNENKSLNAEITDLKEQIKLYNDDGSTMDDDYKTTIAGLKMTIDSQSEEILSLQKNAQELETKYLALYTGNDQPDKLDDNQNDDEASDDTDNIDPEELFELAPADDNANLENAEKDAEPLEHVETMSNADELVDPDEILSEISQLSS